MSDRRVAEHMPLLKFTWDASTVAQFIAKSSARCLSLGDGVYAIPQLLPGLARVFSGLGQGNVWEGSETGLAPPSVVSVAKHPRARTGAGDLEGEPCDTAHSVHTGLCEPLDF